MNLYQQQALNLQLMPPHWRRNAFYVACLTALTKPLATFYAAFNLYVRSVREDVNITPQVQVLESYLVKKIGCGNRDVFFSDIKIQGVIEIYFNRTFQNKEHILRQSLKTYLPAGTTYSIFYF